MIPLDSPLRCPTCRGVHIGRCPLAVRVAPIDDQQAEQTKRELAVILRRGTPFHRRAKAA